MSQNVGRNDPCPCGSGKKYKRCCARKEQEQQRLRVSTQRIYETFDDTVVAVGRWLSLDHPTALEQVGHLMFRELYSENQAAAMPDRLEAHEQVDAVMWNGLDSALAYWRPNELETPKWADLDQLSNKSLRESIEAGEGPRLRPEQVECVNDLLVGSVRFVKVKEFQAAQTLVLEDLANGAVYDYPYPTASFQADQEFVTRIVERSSGGRCMMGFLPIEQDHREAALTAVNNFDTEFGSMPADDSQRRLAERALAVALWGAWLQPFSGEHSDASTPAEGDVEDESKIESSASEEE